MELMPCDMHVFDPRFGRLTGETRTCRHTGPTYLYTDRFGERWTFCKQHHDEATKGGM